MIKITDIETRAIPANGTCDICHKENMLLRRTYFRYEDIKCECHSPYHFDMVDHCYDCEPKISNSTRVYLAVDNSLSEIRRLKLQNIKNEEN